MIKITHRECLEEDQALVDSLHGIATETELSTKVFVFGSEKAGKNGSLRREAVVGGRCVRPGQEDTAVRGRSAARQRRHAPRRRAHLSLGVVVGTGGGAGQCRQPRRRVDQPLERVHLQRGTRVLLHSTATPPSLLKDKPPLSRAAAELRAPAAAAAPRRRPARAPIGEQ